MKLRLLLGAFMFSAITANAQVATLNETFNSFTAGNTTFPQNGWSAVLPLGGGPPAMMIVFNDTANSNQYIQSYSGSNVSTPQYLVSPQIVAPTGNTSVSFKARKNSASAPVMVQAGLASSPTDMSTFVGLGTPTMLTTDTFQTITVAVPSSSSSYLVFRTISAVAAPHTAVDLDDISYDVNPVGTINENFNSFTVGSGAIPQNGWNKVINTVPHNVYTAANNGSTTIQFYAGGVAGATTYLISPKIVAPDGSKKVRFTTNITSSSTGNATIEVGMVSGTAAANMSTFTSLGSPITLTAGSTTPQTITLDVPTSSSQYIAWRFVGAATHSAAYVDDVIYDALGTLATSDLTKSNDAIKFAVNTENTALQFVAKKDPKNIEIYSAGGQKVAGGKLSDRSFDISALQTGVYYIIIETAEGSVVKSKFIKK